MSKISNIFQLPTITSSQARAMGVHPSLLNYYCKQGRLERIARGVYQNKNIDAKVDFNWEDLVAIVLSVPQGVVCLTSALNLYGLTEEIARHYWIAIPHSTSAVKRPKTKIIRLRNHELGKISMPIGKVTIPIYDLERTLVDAFKYLGREVAIKALKEAFSSKHKNKPDLQKMRRYAKKLRVSIDDFLLAVTT